MNKRRLLYGTWLRMSPNTQSHQMLGSNAIQRKSNKTKDTKENRTRYATRRDEFQERNIYCTHQRCLIILSFSFFIYLRLKFGLPLCVLQVFWNSLWWLRVYCEIVSRFASALRRTRARKKKNRPIKQFDTERSLTVEVSAHHTQQLKWN